MARVKTFSSKKDLDAFLNAADSSATSVLNFWADWSEASRQMTDVFVELSNQPQLKDVNFVSVEAESSAEISIGYDIKAVPTFIFVKNGKQFDRVDGAHASELSKRLQTYATTSALPNFVLGKPADQPTLSKEELNERLKRLIQSAPCMVFMKGDADHPKCGFSKQLVSLLNTHEVDFKSFDILQDEAVRQGLKEFSNWPTYPQIYLNGEFLGGLDILRESLESGDLQGRLPIKQSLNDRLKSLINKADVMVFMKGQPDQPKCGFSKTLMQILKDANVKFAHFDILSDEDVRQGLKTYSNWPTYPQVYVKGELIGGLDIIKELKESGDLESTLKV